MFESRYGQSRIVKVDDEQYVEKCYTSVFGIKWYFISSFFWNYPYVADPKERFYREMDFFLEKWEKNVYVPKIVDIDTKTLCIIREFVSGEEVNERNIEIVAKGIREIHEEGFVLGDTKISNFLLTNDKKLAIIDAEQSMKSNNISYKAWDLLVFFLFLSYKLVNLDSFAEASKIFLDEYNPDSSLVKEFFNIKNINLMSVYPPLHLFTLKNLMTNFY
ncbi:serine/threonine protein kinase [Sulfolobus sp. A20]|nr:serine/threonine protein kinase [Sulfolobus sp. A20]TRM77565.1 serine/threonine protein kinase [Sulfolobus sp. B5]TRM81223.1 serine/threonine protein kinase [Sulfolobus sp. D5]TRM87141.1 serine/threonine protein kinase [Sulfolobus sp. C3]TRM97918.1 serine/threonine protein kinase [Sulfolobus sp. B1]TRN00539.1 serine/threonine protein kinase [Sulfolobus sp. E1]TRN01488.1 serine/threonine protein kinase [Sulfolobus sp. F1]